MEGAGRSLTTGTGRPPVLGSGTQRCAPLPAQMRNAARGAIEALAEGKSVVVTGETGTGKSTVMATVLAGLGDEYSVLQLRGAASWSAKPFGGLLWLLSELPPESLSDPVFVLQFIRRVFQEKAAGGRLVLAVENVEDLDGTTMAVLLQLCRAGCALILAAVRDLSACTQEFVWWWSEESVHGEDLEPLPASGTRLLLEDVAGGKISSRVLVQVQARSQGNPLLSELFLREQLESGTVRRRRGTYVWTGSVSYSGALAERVAAETGRLSPAEQYAADVVAVGGSLRLPLLLEVADPAAVEQLEPDLLIASGPARTVRWKDPLLAEAAAALVPPGRAAEIRSRLAAVALNGAEQREPGDASASAGEQAVHAAAQLSRLGRWAEAAEAARSCLERTDAAGHALRGRSDLMSDLFRVFLRCGELRWAAEVLARTDKAAAGTELFGSNDLCEGLVQVLGGKADNGLDYLERAFAQFEEEQNTVLLPLAAAAAAYACVLLDDGDAMLRYLPAGVPDGQHPVPATGMARRDVDPWDGLAECFTGLCAARGVSMLPDGERGAAIRPPYASEALPVLAAAALQGRPGAAQELQAAASLCSGEAALMYLELAEGMIRSHPGRMLGAAQRAQQLGHHLTAYEAARLSARWPARHPGARPDRARLRAARRIENVSYRMLRAANSVGDRLPELSEFERELALDAASGKSSFELAAGRHLSPRTVDWHLGRIFSKLRVSGRTELRECLETENPTS